MLISAPLISETLQTAHNTPISASNTLGSHTKKCPLIEWNCALWPKNGHIISESANQRTFHQMKEVATNCVVRGIAGTDSNVYVLSQWVTLYEFNMVKQRHCNMEKIMRIFLEKYVINSLIWEKLVILWKNINCLVHFLRKWLIFSKNIMFFSQFSTLHTFQNSSDLSLINN